MIRRKKPMVDSTDKAEIDLTPMLDVVFIMLIFFIVTASFVKEVGIGVNVPEPNHAQTPPPPVENILIQVNATNEIWMEGRRVDVRAVRANVERLHAENPKASVIVKADGKSSTQTYIAIADAARAANVHNISLVPDLALN
ncbi:ExbD/TolR family protein [Pseudoteredinibacter isoporae]|uniref:Biopolymer transport protein ExbD n=1 Tax=Pseudoteredinibacter isoporae TaxID=570281 RepID=A0A7X0JXM8_9GAMM|nr:biopolymer transporter ExbD [Pseudoteredinibacter isoporae]MBB6523405.1 biopolymer transport protein ExbD [Pseudoteredinibacter isoporae]NHO88916.1 biopolymer transporter ExbD [Pseudoteredinibacter isoporae]NIB24376.1 biopolymer transporter ExbD [Pseudoteredinibacter isoporae]